MIGDMILWTVLFPLTLGLALGLAGRIGGRIPLGALLFLAALMIVIAFEGFPVFPPVAGKQKLPFALAGLAVLFLLPGLGRLAASRLGGAVLVFLAAGVPALWIGIRILAGAPQKIAIVIVLLVYFALVAALSRKPAGEGGSVGGSAVIALLPLLIGTAVVAVTGGYIGMAQVSGALAAVTGGWLLAGYAAYLRGDDGTMQPAGTAMQAWLVLSALTMVLTTLFAPSVNLLALGLAALPLALAAGLSQGQGALAGLPRALRPVAAGLVAALPAAAAILLSVLA